MSDTAQSMRLDAPAYMRGLGETAREAARLLGRAETAAKNAALLAIADGLLAERARLAAQNRKDLEAGKQRGLDAAMLDRLELTQARIDTMIEGLDVDAAGMQGVPGLGGLIPHLNPQALGDVLDFQRGHVGGPAGCHQIGLPLQAVLNLQGPPVPGMDNLRNPLGRG